MKEYKVAILGATGMVGREFTKVLAQRNFPLSSLQLLASERSAGKRVSFGDGKMTVKEAVPESFRGVDIALFSAGAELSRYFSPIACQAGAVVVDNSSAFRMMESVPLVVPEINPQDIQRHKGIIANPNCSTIQMVVALNPLHQASPIKRIVVSTYQAVSGTGAAAVDELTTQSKQVLDGRSTIPHVYPHQIAFNALPEIDVFLDNGYTKEEWKMVEETRKIMHADEMAISATCVRVPVFTSHSMAVNIEFAKPMSADDARRILAKAPGVKVIDEPVISLYPQPWAAAGTDEVFVGRIRADSSNPNGLVMWIAADNLRKGAALNTVQIAEEMIKREWVKTTEVCHEEDRATADSDGDPFK